MTYATSRGEKVVIYSKVGSVWPGKGDQRIASVCSAFARGGNRSVDYNTSSRNGWVKNQLAGKVFC